MYRAPTFLEKIIFEERFAEISEGMHSELG
jgi:hypothetical protein